MVSPAASIYPSLGPTSALRGPCPVTSSPGYWKQKHHPRLCRHPSSTINFESFYLLFTPVPATRTSNCTALLLRISAITRRHGDTRVQLILVCPSPLLFAKFSSTTDHANRINVNDPSLIQLVNKLQDVFSTVGVC